MSVLDRPTPTRKRERLFIDVPFTKAPTAATDGSGDLVLSGYASTWALDRDDEMVAPNAFDSSLQDYLQSNPIVLWQHDMHQPIGRVTKAALDATGLYVTVAIPNPGPDAADWQKGAYTSIRAGIVTTFSIGGYFTRDVEMGPDGPVFTIVEVELFEISCVSIPANAGSVFEAMVKSFKGEPPVLSVKARTQMEQLLGFADVTDLELVAMDDAQRAERYKLLGELFKRANDGAEPPPMGVWTVLKRAREVGASGVKVAQAKLMVLRDFYQPEPAEEKAGRSISSANQTKLQAALDAHKSIEDSMIEAAEQMKSAAGYHAEAVKQIRDVMGVTDEEAEDAGTSDEDEEEDEPPKSPGKDAPEGEAKDEPEPTPERPSSSLAEVKQLQSDVQLRLRELGMERFNDPSAGTSPLVGRSTYVWVDDVDMDSGTVYYCVYDYDGDGDDDFYAVPFLRGQDGSITLGEDQTEVLPANGYVPKGLDFFDSKGVLSVPSASFADQGHAWDGSAARSRIKDWSGAEDKPNTKYKQAFLWQDGDGSTFGDVKYPVCDVVGGELKCVLKAVSAAASRANTNSLDALKAPLTTLYNRAAKQFEDDTIKPPWEKTGAASDRKDAEHEEGGE